MSTSKEQLSTWFDAGVKKGATHMIVVCDTYDHSDFPVYVEPGEDPRKHAEVQGMPKLQRVMEVYDLRADKAPQLAQERAFNYGDGVAVEVEDPENYGFEALMRLPEGDEYWTRMKGLTSFAHAAAAAEREEAAEGATCLNIVRWTRHVWAEVPSEPMTLCCGVKMMGLGGDPERAVVCWNPLNGVVSCHACGTIYVDSKSPDDYDRWKDVGGGMEQERGVEPDAGTEPVAPWAVICKEHGQMLLTKEQYDHQISRPNSLWHCPTCGGAADWDDLHYDDHLDAWVDANPKELEA